MELHEGELSETSHMKIRIKIIFMSEDQHAQYQHPFLYFSPLIYLLVQNLESSPLLDYLRVYFDPYGKFVFPLS